MATKSASSLASTLSDQRTDGRSRGWMGRSATAGKSWDSGHALSASPCCRPSRGNTLPSRVEAGSAGCQDNDRRRRPAPGCLRPEPHRVRARSGMALFRAKLPSAADFAKCLLFPSVPGRNPRAGAWRRLPKGAPAAIICRLTGTQVRPVSGSWVAASLSRLRTRQSNSLHPSPPSLRTLPARGRAQLQERASGNTPLFRRHPK